MTVTLTDPTADYPTALECLDIWATAAAIHASGAPIDQFAERAEELASAGLQKLGDYEVRRLGGNTRGRLAIITEPRSAQELGGAWDFVRAQWGSPRRMYAAIAAAWHLADPES